MSQPNRSYIIVAAVWCIAESVLLGVSAAVLGAIFQFPGILDKSGADVLPLFQANRDAIIPAYYLFTLSSIILIPLVVSVQRLVIAGQDVLVRTATLFGIANAIVKLVGFIRWSFLVPYLATQYTAPGTDDTTKHTIALIYDAFNFFAGHAIGEHLGFLFDAIWGVLIGIALLRAGVMNRWLAWIWIVLSVGVAANPLELFAGGLRPVLETVYLSSYTAYSIWLLIFGVFWLFTSRSQAAKLTPQVIA